MPAFHLRFSGSISPMSEQPTEKPLERWKMPVTAVLLVLGVVGAAYWLTRQPVQQPIAIPTPFGEGARQIKVDVAGAVARPGLYTLAAGLRTADAIEQAGGVVDGADLARVNLASRLKDGQQVLIPNVASPASTTTQSATP